jgi:hypothetical protein
MHIICCLASELPNTHKCFLIGSLFFFGRVYPREGLVIILNLSDIRFLTPRSPEDLLAATQVQGRSSHFSTHVEDDLDWCRRLCSRSGSNPCHRDTGHVGPMLSNSPAQCNELISGLNPVEGASVHKQQERGRVIERIQLRLTRFEDFGGTDRRFLQKWTQCRDRNLV